MQPLPLNRKPKISLRSDLRGVLISATSAEIWSAKNLPSAPLLRLTAWPFCRSISSARRVVSMAPAATIRCRAPTSTPSPLAEAARTAIPSLPARISVTWAFSRISSRGSLRMGSSSSLATLRLLKAGHLPSRLTWVLPRAKGKEGSE